MSDSMDADDDIAQAWRVHRPYLVNIAYQILGDIGDAEDAAQEAYLRLAGAKRDEIADLRGWLTVVVSRLCLDYVRSARIRRETISDTSLLENGALTAQSVDPADRTTLDDEVSGALLEVLRRLSPAERVSFVLHDVFAVPFATIADTVGRPVGTCRQLARRARAKIESVSPAVADVTVLEHSAVTEKFISACADGDLAALTAVLDPSVWGVGTIVGDPAPASQVNYGPTDVAVNLLRYLGPGMTLVTRPAASAAILGFSGGRLFAIIVLTIRDGRIVKIEATADPAARLGADRTRSGETPNDVP